MTAPRHRLGGELFDRIAVGDGGPEAVRVLRSAQYSRRLMLVREVVARAREHGGSAAEHADRAWELLAAAYRSNPTAVVETLTYPSVGPAQLRSLGTLLGPAAGPADTDLLLATAVVAAGRAGLSGAVTLPVRHGRVLLPSLGAAQFGGAAHGEPACVRTGPAGTTVSVGGQRVRALAPGAASTSPDDPEPDGTGWLALHGLAGDGKGPVLDDLDPDAFPASAGAGRLPAAERVRWQRAFARARRVLRIAHPEQLAEVGAVFRAVVPVLSPDFRDLSGSSNETFGCTGMSAPRTALGFALDLAHEAQHNKLAALTHLFDLVDDRPGELFYAPWREDPRPLVGLLHGVYAHLGVARFWLRQLGVAREPAGRQRAWVEFARWRDVTREANGTLLDSGRLTPVGTRFARRMEGALAELHAQRVPEPAAARAAELARAHRGRWTRLHATRHHPARP
ncbi:HEXXH motif domain-containing protein [Streptomyces sp. LE64]|uniref:HEXXH motif domain-containing protein n=1 Tax=Streptomyces sp. LE64 TaxID=3448653 RepID=UPI0040433DBD